MHLHILIYSRETIRNKENNDLQLKKNSSANNDQQLLTSLRRARGFLPVYTLRYLTAVSLAYTNPHIMYIYERKKVVIGQGVFYFAFLLSFKTRYLKPLFQENIKDLFLT